MENRVCSSTVLFTKQIKVEYDITIDSSLELSTANVTLYSCIIDVKSHYFAAKCVYQKQIIGEVHKYLEKYFFHFLVRNIFYNLFHRPLNFYGFLVHIDILYPELFN